MRELLRTQLLRAATSRAMSPLHRVLMKNSAAIFMLHRFADPERGVDGHPPVVLRRFLAWLRSRDIHLLPLDELVRSVRTGDSLRGGVCFTVDDGYGDFATVGMDVFAEFDCPVTVFLPTSFLDGECWMWWDRIEYVLSKTEKNSLEADFLVAPDRTASPHDADAPESSRAAEFEFRLDSRSGRKRALRDVVERIKSWSETRREEAIHRMEVELGVSAPESVPEPRYAPLSWKQVRRCESRGASFAPHTLTHPWLASEPEEGVREEIEGSWDRLRRQLRDPVPVFAFPYGTRDSFGERDIRLIRNTGMKGAVTTVPRIVDGARRDSPRTHVFTLPRFGFPDNFLDACQITTGILKLRG